MTEKLKDPVKQLLQTWISDRHQALLEQIMMTWEEGMGRFVPDESLLHRILEQATPAPADHALGDFAADTEGDLGIALDLIEAASSQGEVLKRLLEGLQPFAERSALFVIKQGIASLYASRGFEAESPKGAVPVVPPPELEDLIQGRRASIDVLGAAYSALLAPLSRFEASSARILPLRLRRKTVAVLMVDSGLRQVMDHPNHVRALTHVAEATLSFLAGIKEEEKTGGASVEAAPSAPTQRLPEPITETAVPLLDAKVRANAERSARVLVGDIELYFPAKVTQGKQRGNLYGMLKEELDRSRASFTDRYGVEMENQHQIFYQTIVAQLCEGDPSKLGPAPWAPQR